MTIHFIKHGAGWLFTLVVATLVLALTSAAPALAQSERGVGFSKHPPKANRVDRICQYIESKSRDRTPNTPYEYNYQRIVYPAAGISDDEYLNGTDKEISRKVRLLWESEIRHERCGPMGVPSTGDPLRFAMHTHFNDFILEALSLWKIELNHVEHVIGHQKAIGTYLDAVDYAVDRAASVGADDIKKVYENYREALIMMGAKRASELRDK